MEKPWKLHGFSHLKQLDWALEQGRNLFFIDNSEASDVLSYLAAGVSAWYLLIPFQGRLTPTCEGRGFCDCLTLGSAPHGCSVVLHKARPASAVPPALASGNPACSFPNGSKMGMCGRGEVQTTTPVPHVQLKCQYKGISSGCGALWPERSMLHSLLCFVLL